MNANVNVKVKKAGRARRRVGKVCLWTALVVALVWGASRWVWFSAWWVNTRVLVCEGTFVWEPVYGAEVNEPGVRVEWMKYRHLEWLYGWEEIRDDGHWRPETQRWVCRWARCSPWWADENAPERLLFAVILWPVAVVLGAAGAVLLLWRGRAERRARAGLCVRCTYDRAGLAADAVCPECGEGEAKVT